MLESLSNFSDQFQNITNVIKKGGCNMDIMRQYACLFVNPITIYSYGFFLNGATVRQASDSLTTLTKAFIGGLVPGDRLWLGPPWPNLRFSLAPTIFEP